MYKKILVFNINWLGDVLFSEPSMRALKETYPDAKLVCIVGPSCRAVLENNPYVDEIIEFDEKTTHRGLLQRARFIRSIASQKFDVVFLLHRSFTRALLMFLAGIPERIGYSTWKRFWLLTKRVRPCAQQVHRVDHFLGVVQAGGARISRDARYELFLNKDAERSIDVFLRTHGIGEGRRFIVLNPGGNWGPKRWPAENFAALAERITRELGYTVVVTGAEKDKARAAVIAQRAKIIDVTGKTDLVQLAALFTRASIVVSGDSGPLHVASAVGACVIALFGPTSQAITGPRGKGPCTIIRKALPARCRVPCYNKRCAKRACMENITVEDVFKEIRLRFGS
jgi:lipopolysaccharide heptosyltransferase II